MKAQQYKNQYADTLRWHVEFAVGDRVLLLICNLKLHGMQNFRDRFVGLFTKLECVEKTAYRLDLSFHAALYSMRYVFHVSM